MIRLYTDKFYKTVGLQSQYESEYQNIFKQFIGTKKYNDMVNVCSQALPKLKIQCNIQNFPLTFDELIILRPKIIAEIFEYYLSNTKFKNLLDNMFKTVLPQLDKYHKHKKDSDGNYLYKEKYVLDYSYQKYSETIAKFFIDNEPNGYYTISTCYYCNMSYINTFEYISRKDKTVEKRRTYDLDHFIPKSTCSLFALCLYNFVPSCKICNQLKSDDINFYNLTAQNLEELFPTSPKYNYEVSLKFRIKHKKSNNFPPISFLKDKNGKDIRNNFIIKFEKDSISDIYEDKEAEPFKILERYEPHKNEFLCYMEKRLKYPHSFFIMLSNSLSVKQRDQLKEDIFNINFRNDEKPIFRKIYNDLDEQF